MDEDAMRAFEEEMTRMSECTIEATVQKEVDIENDSDYDTDIEIPGPAITPYDQWGKRTYLRMCRKLKIKAIASVLRDLETDSMDLMHRGLKEKDLLAITSCLLDNASVKSLNLEGNPLTPKACHYLYLGLKENLNIEQLNLRNTSLNSSTTPVVAHLLIKNDNFKHVVLSENNFGDDDIKYLERVIEESRNIVYLDLSHNNFGTDSAYHIGHTVANNDSLLTLDLSWNLFSAKDAMHICRGMQENVRVRTLNLAMNGLANKGIHHVQEMLKLNETLTELDLSSNRISDKGAYLLGKALEQNETLRVLKLSKNPITNLGIMGILHGIKKNENSAMKHLNVVSVSLFQSAIEQYTDTMEVHPSFKLIHGPVVDDLAPTETPRIQERLDESNPMQILKYHLIAKRRHLINYYKRKRIGGDGFISKEHFRDGIKEQKIPLTTAHINKLEEELKKTTEEPNFALLILPEGFVISFPPLPTEDSDDDKDTRPSGLTREQHIA